MFTNVNDFVKVYNQVLDPELCRVIKRRLRRCRWQTHTFYDAIRNQSVRHADELMVSFDQFEEVNTLRNHMRDIFLQYINQDMRDYNAWFGAVQGFSGPRFNRYEVGTQMHKHVDHIHSLFDGQRRGIPILSMVGSVNDGYRGGEFVMYEDTVIDLPLGSILVFPSVFMYPHGVKPVTRGTRLTFVSWAF